MARLPDRRRSLHRYLADKDPIVATNAAIALARSGDGSGVRQLADAARTSKINEPMRSAAIESLGALEGPLVVKFLRELIDRFEDGSGLGVSPPLGREGQATAGKPHRASLHAELIRGLARHVDPADDPRFLAALGSPAPEVRLAALEAWSAGQYGRLPSRAVDLIDDRDPRVRKAALRAMARRRHGEAHTHLSAALRDHDFQVRLTAIAALGELGGPKARTTVETQLKSPTDRIRAAAVASLARLGAKQAVLETAEDESWEVRIKVADALAAFPDRDAAHVARQLLDDSSSEVQRHVIQAMAKWPFRRAGPILLEAMGKPALVTRKAAAEELATDWPPAAGFPASGSPSRRQRMLEDLRRRFRQQFGLVDREALAAAGRTRQAAAAITPRQLDEVEQFVRQGDVQALVDFGPELVEALEQLVFDRQQVLPEVIYREVLPRFGPVFAALDGLDGRDLSERRRAADELAQLAQRQPLRRLAVARLNRLVAAEPDQLVWQSVLRAVGGDAGEPSIRLAYTAIGHPSPEVRRRACENLAATADPRHVRVLVPALADSSHAVRCAAVRALGEIGHLDDTEPLRRLLYTGNEELRLDVAIALVRLGDPLGTDELLRLAYNPDPQVRRRVAETMGRMPRPSFVPTLIGMLDDRVAVRRAALASLPDVVGHDVSEADDHRPATTSERIKRWKRWHRQH